jgi:Transposase
VRYYLGVDWADQTHAVWVVDESGMKITARAVPHTAEGLGEWGRELDEWRAQGIELWAAIERPDGRVVDLLLDHGVVVYPVNPKALDRARDRFRQSGAKSDPFDARVLADFLRTDHGHLRALQPSSEAAQELKLLTDDCQRHIRQQTRLVNQLTATLKAYYPRALEVAELTSALAREFLPAYPTPEALTALTERQWQRWARAHRLPEARTGELWAVLRQPQMPVPAHVVRAKARLMRSLMEQLLPVVATVTQSRKAIDDFFASMPAAPWARTLPIGKHGITAPTLWARLGDAPRAVGVVSASASPRRHRTGDQAERHPAAGRPVPLRLRQGVAVRRRPGGVPVDAVECLGPSVLRPAARTGTRSPPGAPRAWREMAADHLRHGGTPRPVRRAVSPGDDDAPATAAASETNRLT